MRVKVYVPIVEGDEDKIDDLVSGIVNRASELGFDIQATNYTIVRETILDKVRKVFQDVFHTFVDTFFRG